MKNQIMAKVSRIKKAYNSAVINVTIHGNGCPQCKTEMPFERPAHNAIACYPEELEQRLDRLQNINMLDFDTNVAMNTLFVVIDGVNEVLCDACKPKVVDLSCVIKTNSNGTKEYPDVILHAPVMDKNIRCQINNLRRSEGLYMGELCYFTKTETGQTLITLTFQWNPKKHDMPLLKQDGKVILNLVRRANLQLLVKSAFEVYGVELKKMAEKLQQHTDVSVNTAADAACDDIESQYFQENK